VEKARLNRDGAHIALDGSPVNRWMHQTTDINNAQFLPLNPMRLGLGDGSGLKFLRGEISEVMIFNRELTAGERDVVATNYFQKRFNLW